jgi:transcriptional regulator with XRE-family HTH domain
MAGVDAAEILKPGRERARLSQQGLATTSGASRTSINAYEAGRRSPTTHVLNLLLAACGLQARVQLEPLQAHVDVQVDALAGPLPLLDEQAWDLVTRSLDDRPAAGSTPAWGALANLRQRRGPVTWAVDGGAALVCHGLAVPADEVGVPEVVVVLDEALRFWMRAERLVGIDARENLVQDWLDADLTRITASLGTPRWCLLGMVSVRVVAELPTTTRMVVPWSAEPVRVVSVDEVERAFPARAEVLARWRQRRATESETGGG